MALINCTECGQELSTDAYTCPHCGKPRNIVKTIPKPHKVKIWKIALTLFISVLIVAGFYLWTNRYQADRTFINYGVVNSIPKSSQSISKLSGSTVKLQEIKNLGLTFSLGEIESSGTTNINDSIKNQITKIVYNAKVPIDILKNTPIIILNNLALTGDQYIFAPSGNLKVPDLKPEWLSEGGIYVTFNGGAAAILINKPIIAQGKLTDVLTHEFAHAIAIKLTEQEWSQYYLLRNIPVSTPRRGTIWQMSPYEDFAEVYKNTFTGIDIKTYYGQLLPVLGMDIGSCQMVFITAMDTYTPKVSFSDMINPKIDKSGSYDIAQSKANIDPKVQACRKDVMFNPSKYSSEWSFGVPYKGQVTRSTRNFISNILSRLNQPQ